MGTITDPRDAARAAVYEITDSVEQALAQMQKLSLDTMTEHDARCVAAEATELANLFAIRSQKVNQLAALNAAFAEEARPELEPIEWSCELLADETGEMDLNNAATEEN